MGFFMFHESSSSSSSSSEKEKYYFVKSDLDILQSLQLNIPRYMITKVNPLSIANRDPKDKGHPYKIENYVPFKKSSSSENIRTFSRTASSITD